MSAPFPPEPAPTTRIGLMVPDLLRLAGMQEILREGTGFVVPAIESPTSAGMAALDLLVIDETATEHLLPLLGMLQQARPQLRLLVIGHDETEPHMERVVAAGASGYLLHRATAPDLRAAVGEILGGSMWVPRRVLARLLERARRGAVAGSSQGPVRFSRREGEVLQLLVGGSANREIAAALGVEEGTVKAHLSRMMRKAGVRSRTGLSIAALREGWTKR